MPPLPAQRLAPDVVELPAREKTCDVEPHGPADRSSKSPTERRRIVTISIGCTAYPHVSQVPGRGADRLDPHRVREESKMIA